MPTKDPRVDAYIAKSAAFAQPILKHLRRLAHAALPEFAETLKWGMPHFTHRGILFGMAAFKQHCTLHFWNRSLVFAGASDAAMGQFGRITALSDLPSDRALTGFMKKAFALDDAGVKPPARKLSRAKKELVVPDYFKAALRKNPKALAAFEKFSYSHRKEYVQWITEAKREETRVKRMVTTIEWLTAGKSRNWKYES